MAVPILAAAGAAAARAAGTQIAKRAAVELVKGAAKEAAKNAAKDVAKNMVRQKAANAIRGKQRGDTIPIPSPGSHRGKPAEDTTPRPADMESVESPDSSISGSTETGTEALDEQNVLPQDTPSATIAPTDVSVNGRISGTTPPTREPSSGGASASPKPVIGMPPAGGLVAAAGGLVARAGQLSRPSTGLPGMAGATSGAASAGGAAKAVANVASNIGGRGGLKGVLGNTAGSLLNRGGLQGNKNKSGGNPIASAAKGALLGATVLNPLFWLFLLGLIGFIIVVVAIVSLFSMIFGGLFGGGGDASTIENEDTTFIPTVNVVGATDPCGSLTTDEAREAAGCDDASSGGGGGAAGEWFYYNQVTPNWDTNEEWGQACGLVAFAQILTAYGGPEYTPDYVRHDIFGYSGTGNGNDGSSIMDQGKAVSWVNEHQNEIGLRASDQGHWCNGSFGWDEIERVCNAGGCVEIYQTYYSSGGRHWIVVKSVSGDDVTIGNPATGSEEVVSKANIISGGCPNGPGGPTDCLVFEKI